MARIIVQDTEITVSNVNGEDYICITDMLKAKDGDFFVTDWLRNRNTMEFLGVWERIYNPNFNYGEFAIIRSNAGLNSYKISVKEFERLKEKEQEQLGWNAKRELAKVNYRIHTDAIKENLIPNIVAQLSFLLSVDKRIPFARILTK